VLTNYDISGTSAVVHVVREVRQSCSCGLAVTKLSHTQCRTISGDAVLADRGAGSGPLRSVKTE
jgi:hypothetical protein